MLTNLLSNAAAMSSLGVIILAVTIVVVAIWVAVLSVKCSKLKKIVLLQEERIAEMSVRGVQDARRGAAGKGAPVSASGMPATGAPSGMAPVGSKKDEDKPQKSRGRKGKPTIPFGANKEAQAQATRALADMAEPPDYNPDSIDFSKVEGLRQRPQPQPEPRPRKDAQMMDLQVTGRMPVVAAKEAAPAAKPSYDRVAEELRSRTGVSSAWVDEDARRVVERHERQAKRQRLSERRQQEQLRRQAESIVAEHNRQRGM